tara:strand:+ start:4902 stop:6281 length:1380 start_codon:yes stop_codon:yes gene_type:complete
MLKTFLKSKGILGMNARNLSYIRPSNAGGSMRLADNKLTAKKILRKNNIPVPRNYGIIKTYQDIENFDWNKLPSDFALKPNRGLGGEGIMIAYGQKKNGNWVKASRSELSQDFLKNHIRNILDGNYSLFNIPDTAFFEERLKILKLFKPYAFKGIPDIRIIVYNKVPMMAMLRLPTQASDGRANLHQGGLGVGIDMGTGITTTAITKMPHDRIIEYAPGTRLPLSGIKIPNWNQILYLAVKAQKVSGLGYLGADIVIDREKGPIFLELNARPGLSIQTANMAPLKERLERVKGLEIKNPKRGVRLAKDLFGGEIEDEIEESSGRKVIGINEQIEIIDNKGTKHPIVAKIDTGAYRTTICRTLAEQFGVDKMVDEKKVKSALGIEKRPIIHLEFILDEKRVNTEAFIADRAKLKYDIIIGRRDLKRFLVDPSKRVFMTEKTKNKHLLQSLKKRLRHRLGR